MKDIKFNEISSGDFEVTYWLRFHDSDQYRVLCQAHASNVHYKIITGLPKGVRIKADCTAQWNVPKVDFDKSYEMADKIDEAVNSTIAEWKRIKVLRA